MNLDEMVVKPQFVSILPPYFRKNMAVPKRIQNTFTQVVGDFSYKIRLEKLGLVLE